MDKVSSKELLIISHLRHDARLKLTKLSRLTGIPVSTIFDRIKTGSSLVQKHTTLIDFQQLGFTVRAHVILKVKKEERDALHSYLMNHKHINNAYRINNGYDFMVEGIFKHLKDLEDFLEGLEESFKLKAKQVYYIIDDLKREAFLSNPEYLQLVMGEE
jgi:DNA-binding Lrp family transcriptional regulator